MFEFGLMFWFSVSNWSICFIIIMEINNKGVVLLGSLVIHFIPYVMTRTVFETILYGLTNTVFISYCVYNVYNILMYQVIYFYLICVYLKIKIKILSIHTKSNHFSNDLFQSFNSLYNEINDYNTTFGLKFCYHFG